MYQASSTLMIVVNAQFVFLHHSHDVDNRLERHQLLHYKVEDKVPAFGTSQANGIPIGLSAIFAR
jgi:hypothetical protein